MKLLIVVVDGWSVKCEYEHTGICRSPERRAVEIELTDEQIKKIGLQKVGTSKGNPIYEGIESVSVLKPASQNKN